MGIPKQNPAFQDNPTRILSKRGFLFACVFGVTTGVTGVVFLTAHFREQLSPTEFAVALVAFKIVVSETKGHGGNREWVKRQLALGAVETLQRAA